MLPRVTHGQVLLHISHRKFAEINYQVNVPSPPKGIVLYRGATWKGRVLDPDGEILDQCKIQFADPTKTILVQSSCSREGFVLDHLPPGDGSIEIRLDFHPHLGKRVVAEGVEDQETWDLLAAAGCHVVQGYALSRPLPSRLLAPLLDELGVRRPTLGAIPDATAA